MISKNIHSKRRKPVKVGEIFGRLTVVSEDTKQNMAGNRYFNCKCECGAQKLIRGASLRANNTVSCGCYRIENNRKAAGEVSWTSLWNDYKYGAKSRNLLFSLTFEEFKHVASRICEYCGAAPRKYNHYIKTDGTPSLNNGATNEGITRSWINANGIDRIDNNTGYELNNCVPCCSFCNFIKSDMDSKEWVAWINRLVKFRIDK